jgi:hypothetical protein
MNTLLQDTLSELREETRVLCERIRQRRTNLSGMADTGIIASSGGQFAASAQVEETAGQNLLAAQRGPNDLVIPHRPSIQLDNPPLPPTAIETVTAGPSHSLFSLTEVNGFISSWFPMLSNVGKRLDTLIRKSWARP